MNRLAWFALAVLCLAPAVSRGSPAVDETSSGDKLRILYSKRLTFNDDGLPLITIEIMSGQTEVRLGSPGGVTALPDGEGGAAVSAGDRWVITLEAATAG